MKIKNYLLKLILIILGIVILVFYITMARFKIPSGAMIPTLLVGDHILVNKYDYKVKRGDVVVLLSHNSGNDRSKIATYYVQRIIGLPGDSLDIEGRNLVINGRNVDLKFVGFFEDERSGEKLDEYYEKLSDSGHRTIFRQGKQSTNRGTYLPINEIPKDYVFVMGDNRDNSQDSRFWGFVPIENIVGKAVLIYWSWDFLNPDLINKVRWNRILSSID